ncbi:MAG: 2-amino-4-hydroxy-6-hydroxymethyldihydropteridine diphosphokinase [Halanaerobium sp.]
MNKAYLGLGSNIEPRLEFLKTAAQKINQNSQIKIKKESSVYLTKPYGYLEQEDFLNAVLLIETSLKPKKLLDTLLNVEKEMGRERKIEWGPRKIDIDILFYDNIDYQSSDLIIPHPEIEKRAFVLIPLLEISEKELSLKGKKLTYWLEQLDYEEKVEIYSAFPEYN